MTSDASYAHVVVMLSCRHVRSRDVRVWKKEPRARDFSVQPDAPDLVPAKDVVPALARRRVSEMWPHPAVTKGAQWTHGEEATSRWDEQPGAATRCETHYTVIQSSAKYWQAGADGDVEETSKSRAWRRIRRVGGDAARTSFHSPKEERSDCPAARLCAWYCRPHDGVRLRARVARALAGVAIAGRQRSGSDQLTPPVTRLADGDNRGGWFPPRRTGRPRVIPRLFP